MQPCALRAHSSTAPERGRSLARSTYARQTMPGFSRVLLALCALRPGTGRDPLGAVCGCAPALNGFSSSRRLHFPQSRPHGVVELTENLLVKAAGWDVVKQARAMLAADRVLSSSWTAPLLKGVVQAGPSSYRAGLVIKGPIDIENLCTCRESRDVGILARIRWRWDCIGSGPGCRSEREQGQRKFQVPSSKFQRITKSQAESRRSCAEDRRRRRIGRAAGDRRCPAPPTLPRQFTAGR